MNTGKPIVLCFSGLDPSGGAGVQADAETLLSLGCHCAPVATVLTVQDTVDASRMVPVVADLIADQARTVLADMSVSCFKLGLFGSVGAITAVSGLLREHDDIPVVMDPVCAAGGGYAFTGPEVLTAMRESLLPAAFPPEVVTGDLLRRGCGSVLLTGGHESGKEVVNRWFRAGLESMEFRWRRLAHEFHGSGCTLSSAIAANLALGHGMETALRNAQQFTWQALDRGWRAGAGQHLPERGFTRES